MLPTTHEMADKAHEVGEKAGGAMHWISSHTGVPVVLVAALVIVLSWKLFKAGLHLAVEVACVAVLLIVATHLGWITF